jgi:hypothetical protein
MKKYKITPTGSNKSVIVDADNVLEVANKVKDLGISAKITLFTDRKVTVTCGWGKAAHKWEAARTEAIAHRNTCPDHRSS